MNFSFTSKLTLSYLTQQIKIYCKSPKVEKQTWFRLKKFVHSDRFNHNDPVTNVS